MNAEEMFDVWAPADSVWAAWVKPVLFAHLGTGRADAGGRPSAEEMAAVLTAVPPADGGTAVVVDLPGVTGVMVGVELALRGYRPVPLYNAVPGPTVWAVGADVVCDLGPIVWAIREATPVLAGMGLREDAPPVLLLDADRSVGTGRRPGPGVFDNRSVSLPTDFPSANLLLSRGVRRVVVVQPDTTVPQPDLAHTLLRYQEAGIEVAGVSLARPGKLERVIVTRPPMFRRLWHRFRATLGLQRNRLGGFGGMLPEPSASGG